MPYDVFGMSKVVYRNMGAPTTFSYTAFQKAFQKEFKNRNLGEDAALYRRLFGAVIRQVKRFISQPPKNLPATPSPPDFKKLAANDIG